MNHRGSMTRGAARLARAMPLPGMDWAYFLDIDGTLVDIADAPDEVRVDRELLGLIQRLYHGAGGAVALISGRSIADIDKIFQRDKLPSAGQHGIERRDADGHLTRHEFPIERLAAVRERLAERVARYPNELLLEDKGLSLALHYRKAPRLASFAHGLIHALRAELGSDFTVQRGKRVVELKPAGKDKGSAICEFMQEAPFRGRRPVFLGDDVTDEYGFAMVNRLRGHSVKVGAGATVARWRLRNVRGVRDWLARGLAAAPPALPPNIADRENLA